MKCVPFIEPILIFAEHHTDSVTFKILAKMTQELKDKGYDSFFDEIPVSMASKIEEYFENEEKTYLELKNKFTALNLNIEDASDVDKYFQTLKTEITSQEDWLKETSLIEDNIEKHEARVSFLIFLKTLTTYKIDYKGIDSDLVLAKMPVNDMIALTSVRDRQMSQAYLESRAPIYSRIGLSHAEGIQNEIIQIIPKEEAKDRFIFFYIYSKELSSTEDWIFFNEIQTGKRNLPLDIVIIDAINLTEEEVIQKIKIKIQEKELALRQYQKEEKTEQPEIKIETTPELNKRQNDETKSEKNQSASIVFLKPAPKTVEEKKQTLAVRVAKMKPFM